MTDTKINELAEILYRAQCPHGKWEHTIEGTREWYRRGVRLVLEQAGVERLERHNALLTIDIEGWKKQVEFLRAKLAEKDAEIARLHERLLRYRDERDHYRDAALGLREAGEP